MGPTLLVLAAGMGSRYGGLKQVEPVGPSGEIILDYSVYDAVQAGFDKVVFVIRKDIEAPFRDSIGRRLENKVHCHYVFQELADLPAGYQVPEDRTKPWGTGQAILAAAEAIETPFAAINADDFYGRQAFQLVGDELRRPTGEYCMVGFVLRNTLSEHGSVSRGLCTTDQAGYLRSIEEHVKIFKDGRGGRSVTDKGELRLTGDEVVSMNLWGLRPDIFGHLEALFREFLDIHGGELKSEFYIPSVIDRLITDRLSKVKVLTSNDPWFGVTYPEDKPVVVGGIRRQVEEGAYPERLWG